MIEVLKQMYQLLLTEPHAPAVCDQLEVILRQAIAELESQEPVAWAMDYDIESVLSGFSTSLMGTAMRIESAFPKHRVKLLYTTPPAQPAQPEQEPKHHRHTWGKDGECCVVCGDKDWMGTSCKPPAAQRTKQNFCSRCGKRTKDLTHIHTCTPPQD
jgi:hypothetical protein